MFIKSILPFFTILLFIFFFTTAAFAANKDYHNFLPFFDEAVAINIFLQIITINTVLKVTAAVSGHLSFSLKLPPEVPGRLAAPSSPRASDPQLKLPPTVPRHLLETVYLHQFSTFVQLPCGQYQKVVSFFLEMCFHDSAADCQPLFS